MICFNRLFLEFFTACYSQPDQPGSQQKHGGGFGDGITTYVLYMANSKNVKVLCLRNFIKRDNCILK